MAYPKGKPKSEESKRSASASCLKVWTPQKKRDRSIRYTGVGNPFFGRKHSGKSLKKMSVVHSGVDLSEDHKRKISISLIGNQNALGSRHSLTEDQKRKIGERSKGEKCTFWKGGITKTHFLIRNSAAYKRWRKSVFERDDFTCQSCGKRGVTLEAHHIKAFSIVEDGRLNVSNGKTLCVPCHKETPTYGRNTHTTVI